MLNVFGVQAECPAHTPLLFAPRFLLWQTARARALRRLRFRLFWAAIVMYDAMGVRRETGRTGPKLLNKFFFDMEENAF